MFARHAWKYIHIFSEQTLTQVERGTSSSLSLFFEMCLCVYVCLSVVSGQRGGNSDGVVSIDWTEIDDSLRNTYIYICRSEKDIRQTKETK